MTTITARAEPIAPAAEDWVQGNPDYGDVTADIARPLERGPGACAQCTGRRFCVPRHICSPFA